MKELPPLPYRVIKHEDYEGLIKAVRELEAEVERLQRREPGMRTMTPEGVLIIDNHPAYMTWVDGGVRCRCGCGDWEREYPDVLSASTGWANHVDAVASGETQRDDGAQR